MAQYYSLGFPSPTLVGRRRPAQSFGSSRACFAWSARVGDIITSLLLLTIPILLSFSSGSSKLSACTSSRRHSKTSPTRSTENLAVQSQRSRRDLVCEV